VRRREETIRRQLARETALKARFDDIFERAGDVIVVHDRRGRVSTINRAGEHATGYSREEARTIEPSWIFAADYIECIGTLIAEGPESLPRTFRSELLRRRGPRVPVDVDARVLVGDGQVVGVVAIARDRTERDRLENELRQAQKMEAVGRLATGIAHDFNNLITVLIGYSDELLEEAPEGSAVHHAAASVRKAADRASGLTRQLLAFSRREAAAPLTVDLNRVIRHMEDMLRRLVGPEIRLELTLAADLGSISADESQIGQVVMNLVVNARDAMPEGGALAISTANVDLGAEHLDVIPGPHVQLTVADTGQGIAAEVRDRLFEPFFTTKDHGQGTGLGLSMVQSIVRQCGGHIVVDSQPGAGSRFHVYFPAAGARTTRVRGEGVILLAEDDPAVRRLVVMELTRRGFTVVEAEDGRHAVEVLGREGDRIDMLVTDVVMPRMNGADLAKEVERVRPGLKILFISGHPERAGAGLDPTGVTNLLMKPFTADTLAARVKEMMSSDKETDGSRA
jgi:PAS domain S-box-containing protein